MFPTFAIRPRLSTHSVVGILMFLFCVLTGALAAARPNIVIIFSDDHAYQAISAYGDKRKLVETPAIDRLAHEGMRFDRCLVPNSICGPSRATVLTGKYSHKNGFANNRNSRFDGSQPTFPKALGEAGYATAIVGKWHLVTDPTGFDYWEILPGHGQYYNPTFITAKGRVHSEGYVTDIITDRALSWLESRDKDKPFLLMLQHKAPHRIWEPALRHLDHDHGRVYPEPDTLFDDFAGRGRAVADQDMMLASTYSEKDAKLVAPADLNEAQRAVWDKYYEPRNAEYRKNPPTGRDLIRWRYQRYMHDYLGTIRGIDESVGRVLSYLDAQGLAENTIVIYASDQGFYLGEHGWFDKRWIFEESLRTPFIVRWPKVIRPGSVNGAIVSTIDFAPTLIAAAGARPFPEIQGASMLPIWEGHTPAQWRQSFYYHYYEYPLPHHVRPHYGVVTDRYKLVHFYGPDLDEWGLFDRVKDPEELRSFYDDPAYKDVRQDLARELAKLRKDLQVPDPDPKGFSGR